MSKKLPVCLFALAMLAGGPAGAVVTSPSAPAPAAGIDTAALRVYLEAHQLRSAELAARAATASLAAPAPDPAADCEQPGDCDR